MTAASDIYEAAEAEFCAAWAARIDEVIDEGDGWKVVRMWRICRQCGDHVYPSQVFCAMCRPTLDGETSSPVAWGMP